MDKVKLEFCQSKIDFFWPNINQLVPELPPRIDRASKPGISTSTPASSLPSRNSSILQSGSGTLGRSAQDRFFGTMSKEQDDLYTTSNKLMNTMDTKKMNGTGSNANSLERHDMIMNSHGSQHQASLDRSNPIGKNGSSYDSVSSYDSYNTSQLHQVNSNRLGPNAPDDLKSVPNSVGRPPLDSTQDISSRDYSFDSDKTNAMNLPQRPSNLLVDSPRKQQLMESKTDYGKYRYSNLFKFDEFA